ncbi:MAG: hypothetical protein ACJA2W_004066, partial [Planctomycetota bacterium]
MRPRTVFSFPGNLAPLEPLTPTPHALSLLLD